MNFHHYNFYDGSSKITQPDAAAKTLASVPTPGPNNRAAAPGGTLNDAGPLAGSPKNYVMSFSVKSPDPSKYTDIVVNYTVSGKHVLNEGFVMRYGVIGDKGQVTGVRTYGEGNSVIQWGYPAIVQRLVTYPITKGVWDKVNSKGSDMRISIYAATVVASILFFAINYFAIANQYIAGGTVSKFYLITSTYVIWNIVVGIISIKSGFVRPFLAYISIVPMLSLVGGELMYISSIGFSVVLGLAFAGFCKMLSLLNH